MVRQLIPWLSTITIVLYPVFIFLGVQKDALPQWLGLAVLCLAPTVFLRFKDRKSATTAGPSPLAALWFLPAVTLAMLLASALLGRTGIALGTPVAIHLILLLAFGGTLFTERPMIERFARLIDGDLSPEKQRWCRQWTHIWCLFFLLNAGICLTLALVAPIFWWSLYTSLLAYILMGLLFSIERIGRWQKFERPTSPRRRYP